MPSNVQWCDKRKHCSMWAEFFVVNPPAHGVSPLKQPHFILFSLLQVYPVRSRFRPRHVSQGLPYLFAGTSLRQTIPKRDVSLDRLCHSLHCMTYGGGYDSFTLVSKSVLDFRRLLAGMCPNRERVSCSICLVLSILAHTSLLMSGGAITANKYTFST